MSSKNYTLCSGDDIYVNKNDYGIITSTNYPNWTPNEYCVGRIFAPTGYVIRIYVNDYNIEDVDENSFGFEKFFCFFLIHELVIVYFNL